MKAVPIGIETFPSPPVSYPEIFRYAACLEPDEALLSLCRESVEELEKRISFRVIHGRCPCWVEGEKVDLGFGKICSQSLARALSGCREAVLFAATVGVEADRAIARYQSIRPGKALLVNAAATQRVEALCDAFCEKLKEQEGERGNLVRPRFSPGYGDLPLSFQKDIFSFLSPERIGITLNENCFMIPTKSVTALVGICKKQEKI